MRSKSFLFLIALIFALISSACNNPFGKTKNNSDSSKVPVTNNKAAGSALTKPAVIGIPTINSITVGAVTLITATGQEIEYAISKVDNADLEDSLWTVDKLSFTGLDSNTTYYVYARSKENTTHNAGAPNISDGIKTFLQEGFSIYLADLNNPLPEITGPTIYASMGGDDKPNTARLIIETPGLYNNITWFYNAAAITNPVTDMGVTLALDETNLTLSASPASLLGEYFVAVELIAKADGKLYSKLISFNVRP